MTDTLAAVANDFAKRCLGWEVTFVSAHAVHAGDDFLLYNNLDAAMRRAQKWLEQYGLWLYMECAKTGGVFVASYYVMDDQCLGLGTNASHCHALLEACVNARRNMGTA